MGSHFFGGIKRIDLVRVYIIHHYSQTVCLKAVLATDSGTVVCCASDSFFHQQVSWTVWPPAASPIHYAYTHRLQRCHWVSVHSLSLSKLFTLSFSVWLFACSTESAKYWNPLCLGSCQVQLHHSFSPSSCPITHYCSLLKFFFKEKKSFMFFNVNDKALTSHRRNCYCKRYLICIFFWVTSWLMKLASV